MNTSKKVMIVIGFLLIVGFVVMTVVEYRRPKIPEFEPLDGQIALLHKARQKWFGEPMPILDSEPGVQVVCDWIRYRGSVATDAEDAGEWADKFHADSMDLVMSMTLAADYWASRVAFEEWVAIFNGNGHKRDEVIARCTDTASDIAESIDADIHAFRVFASGENLIDSEGRLRTDRLDIVDLIYRHLWITLAADQLPRAAIEPPEEKIAFLRWQTEQSAMPVEKKIQKLSLFEEENSAMYDFSFALAVVYAQNGMHREACRVLHDALSKIDGVPDTGAFRKQRYQKTLAQLRRASPDACDLSSPESWPY